MRSSLLAMHLMEKAYTQFILYIEPHVAYLMHIYRDGKWKWEAILGCLVSYYFLLHCHAMQFISERKKLAQDILYSILCMDGLVQFAKCSMSKKVNYWGRKTVISTKNVIHFDFSFSAQNVQWFRRILPWWRFAL